MIDWWLLLSFALFLVVGFFLSMLGQVLQGRQLQETMKATSILNDTMIEKDKLHAEGHGLITTYCVESGKQFSKIHKNLMIMETEILKLEARIEELEK